MEIPAATATIDHYTEISPSYQKISKQCLKKHRVKALANSCNCDRKYQNSVCGIPPRVLCVGVGVCDGSAEQNPRYG